MCPLKTPFLRPPGHFPRPHFRICQFLTTLHLPEITNFWKICISEPQNQGKVSVLTPRIWSNFSSKCLELDKRSVTTPNLVAVHSLSPYFQALGLHTHAKVKVEYPLGPCLAPSSSMLGGCLGTEATLVNSEKFG